MSENKNEFETIDFEADKLTEKNKKNIFSDFNTDSTLEKEMKKIREKKDTFFYLSISLKFLQTLFGFSFFIILGFLGYIFIQNSENFSEKEFLNPICGILNGDLPQNGIGCSSISANKIIMNNNLKNLSEKQSLDILKILPNIYEIDSFLKSKEISFLLEKSNNKLKTLEVLEKFNYFKNEFTGIEKKKLRCSEIIINGKEKTLSVKCDAYSAGYNSEIIGFSGNKNNKQEYLSGTSISVANSFINFLEKNAIKYFLILEKQKSFESEYIIGSDGYTNKTSFDLKLKINF